MKLIVAMILMVFAGCRHATSEQQYINYINDPEHKITQQIKIGDVQATVKWLPAGYRKLKSEKLEEPAAAEEGEGFYFFDVKFDKTKGEKPVAGKLAYLDFDIQKDFVLLKGKDSLLPLICQKIENGIGGSYQYMLVFEKQEEELTKDFAVVYNDKVFGTGTLAFVYNQEDISKIPKLKSEESK
ncbi:MAG TPA: hypothetical protein VGO58_13725 [Chitinophagaceae bacterium]|nr:hypothetical protein [Chitinophagaceae bacterium]